MVQVVQIIMVMPLPLHHKVLVCFVFYVPLAGCDTGRKRQVGSNAGPEAQKERGGFFPTTTCRSVNPQALLLKVMMQYVICQDNK